jgi:ligand-binding sensor domain-containing protein
LDIQSGKFRHYISDPDKTEGLSDNIVFSIYEDMQGKLWIGTNSGLNLFDPATEKFRRFGIYDGLPNEVIYGILSDENDNLWLSTNKGICRFNINTYEAKNFSANDGLQSNEFNGGAFHKGHSGSCILGVFMV